MQKVTAIQQTNTATNARRQGSTNRWTYTNVSTSLMNQVDHATKTLMSYGAPKFESKRSFIESAIIEKLQREGITEEVSA